MVDNMQLEIITDPTDVGGNIARIECVDQDTGECNVGIRITLSEDGVVRVRMNGVLIGEADAQ